MEKTGCRIPPSSWWLRSQTGFELRQAWNTEPRAQPCASRHRGITRRNPMQPRASLREVYPMIICHARPSIEERSERESVIRSNIRTLRRLHPFRNHRLTAPKETSKVNHASLYFETSWPATLLRTADSRSDIHGLPGVRRHRFRGQIFSKSQTRLSRIRVNQTLGLGGRVWCFLDCGQLASPGHRSANL